MLSWLSTLNKKLFYRDSEVRVWVFCSEAPPLSLLFGWDVMSEVNAVPKQWGEVTQLVKGGGATLQRNEVIAVPRASPRACKQAFTLLKTEKRVQ